MSFQELVKADYKPKEQEVIIKLGDKELKFKAVEIPATKKLAVQAAKLTNDDWALELIVASIIDQDGKKMTMQQAQALSEEYVMTFFVAASKVNFPQEEEIKN